MRIWLSLFFLLSVSSSIKAQTTPLGSGTNLPSESTERSTPLGSNHSPTPLLNDSTIEREEDYPPSDSGAFGGALGGAIGNDPVFEGGVPIGTGTGFGTGTINTGPGLDDPNQTGPLEDP